MGNAKRLKNTKKWKILQKLENTTNEKYWKQCTEIHFRPFAMTASSELTRTCVRHRFDWKHNMIPFFYRQIVTVQANFVWLTHKVGFQTGHRRPSRYARVKKIALRSLCRSFSFSRRESSRVELQVALQISTFLFSRRATLGARDLANQLLLSRRYWRAE